MKLLESIEFRRGQHRRNVETLKRQASLYGSGIPLWLSNSIESEEKMVKRVEEELDKYHAGILTVEETETLKAIALEMSTEQDENGNDMTNPQLDLLEQRLYDILHSIGEVRTEQAIIRKEQESIVMHIRSLEERVILTEDKFRDDLPSWVIPAGTAAFLIMTIVLALIIFIPSLHT